MGGGAKLNLALVWNVRTWPAMRREKAQVAERLGVKFPGSTRPDQRSLRLSFISAIGGAADHCESIERSGVGGNNLDARH